MPSTITNTTERVAEAEPEADAHRALAVGHQLAGGVVDGRDVVGVEGVPHAEGVRREAEADAEDRAADLVVVRGDDPDQQPPAERCRKTTNPRVRTRLRFSSDESGRRAGRSIVVGVTASILGARRSQLQTMCNKAGGVCPRAAGVGRRPRPTGRGDRRVHPVHLRAGDPLRVQAARPGRGRGHLPRLDPAAGHRRRGQPGPAGLRPVRRPGLARLLRGAAGRGPGAVPARVLLRAPGPARRPRPGQPPPRCERVRRAGTTLRAWRRCGWSCCSPTSSGSRP